jgi:hypothetical protein
MTRVGQGWSRWNACENSAERPALPQGHAGLRRAGAGWFRRASEQRLPPSPVSALGLATSNQVRGVLLRSAAPGGSRGLGVRSGDRNLAEIDRSDAVWRGGWCRTLYPPSGGRERTPVARDCRVRVGVDPVACETGHGETRSFLPTSAGSGFVAVRYEVLGPLRAKTSWVYGPRRRIRSGARRSRANLGAPGGRVAQKKEGPVRRLTRSVHRILPAPAGVARHGRDLPRPQP